jgi:hypothetical protein
LTNDHNRYLISCHVRYKSKMDFCRINHWHVYPIPTCSILFYVIPGCSMCAYSSLYMSIVVYMCLEWPWENEVFFRDSAGIRRVLYRTLFECCSDLPGECSGALRRNAKKVRTKSVVIPAQDRIDIGSQLHGVQEKFLAFLFISGNKKGGHYDLLHHSRYGMTSSIVKGVISQNSLKVIHSRLALPNFLRISVR